MREVRWIIQVSRKGVDDWMDRSDLTYTGWFYSTGNDQPTETLLDDYEKAVTQMSWLDVRLVQEERSFTSKVIREHIRNADEPAV